MTIFEFIEAGFNRAFDQLAKNQEENFKMLSSKIQELSDAVAQTKVEVKNQFDRFKTEVADLTTQSSKLATQVVDLTTEVTNLTAKVADLEAKLKVAEQPADTTDVEQDLNALIADVKTIGK